MTWAQASDDVQRRDFEKKAWQRATQGIDYSEDVVKERKPKQNQPGENGGNQRRPINFGGNAAPILQAFIILLLVIALFFLIRSLLGLNTPKNKAIKPVLSVEELAQLEENLHQADLDDFIKRALAQENYALAIRLYYLAILKELSLKNIIIWKKDKTNREYLREMNRTPLAADFTDLTLIFERVWYGNIILQSQDFIIIEPKFKHFIQQINQITSLAAK
ncbi:MAG: DUF4129 domain-containing protein [Saprospiraceae bacterium]